MFKTNYEALRTELDKYDWQELLDSNFEDDYEKFFNILKDLQRQHTPLKTPSKSKKSIYMTKEALRLKKSVNRHWKKYKTTGSKHDKDSYTLRKNKLRKLTRNLRHNFEQCTAAELKNKPKTFWRYANSQMKTKPTVPTLINQDNGSKATNPLEKANLLNNFFTSVFVKEDLDKIPEIHDAKITADLSDVKITPEIVYEKLINLKSTR